MYARKYPKINLRIVCYSANNTKIPPFCVFVLYLLFTGGFWRINSTNLEGFIGNLLVLHVLYIYSWIKLTTYQLIGLLFVELIELQDPWKQISPDRPPSCFCTNSTFIEANSTKIKRKMSHRTQNSGDAHF